MKIERNNLEKSIVELIVEADVKEVAKYRKKAITHISENTEIKGFRKWVNIPENVLVKQVWEDTVNQTVVNFAIDDLYRKALMESKVIPVAQGEIKEIVSQNPLIIKIHVEVLPEVSVDSTKMKLIKLSRKKVSVTAAEVKTAIGDIEKRFSTFDEVKTWAQMGDRVTIDTDGYDLEGKIIETTSMRAYPLVLGSNLLVAWFEEQVVWAKLWAELELDITFPKDYHNASFAWKDTKFKVTVLKVESSVKPEWTPKFIEDLRGKKLDMDGFKSLVKSEILDTKQSNQNIEDELKLIEELLKVSKLDIWEKMISEQVDRMFDEVKENMLKQNIKMKDYLESLKLDEVWYKENHIKPDATKRLQWELILNNLVDVLKPTVSDAEVTKEVENIKKNYENEEVLKRLDEMYKPETENFGALKRKMMMKKVIDWFYTAEK